MDKMSSTIEPHQQQGGGMKDVDSAELIHQGTSPQGRPARFSTRRLGAGVAVGAAVGTAALAAGPAFAAQPFHTYAHGACEAMGHNFYGPGQGPTGGGGGYMHNWGMAGIRCSGSAQFGYACITEQSSTPGFGWTNLRGTGKYLCDTTSAGATINSQHTTRNSMYYRPVVRLYNNTKYNHTSHLMWGSSSNNIN